jgi:glutamyl-tRNA reductase
MTLVVLGISYKTAPVGLREQLAIAPRRLIEAMPEKDVVVSSTGCPDTLLHRADLEKVMRARRNRPLVLPDIAVPRDIAPGAQFVDNVHLYNIDHLEEIARENVRHRDRSSRNAGRSSISGRTPCWTN